MNDPASIGHGLPGHDAAGGAAGPSGDDDAAVLILAARTLLTELPRAGVTRLAGVGGAGSLAVTPGVRLAGTPQFPAALNPLGLAHAEALEICRSEGGTLDWSYLSPPPFQGRPGERSGPYRTGTDIVLDDPGGTGCLPMEDMAVATVDELERPRFVRQRSPRGTPRAPRMAPASHPAGGLTDRPAERNRRHPGHDRLSTTAGPTPSETTSVTAWARRRGIRPHPADALARSPTLP